VDENALYAQIDDVIPDSKSRDVKHVHVDHSHYCIVNETSDPAPIYSVVNKHPTLDSDLNQNDISPDLLSSNNDKKKKKQKKNVHSEDTPEG